MRILIVTWAWPPIGRVGTLRPVGFATEWTRAGHEVHVLTGPGTWGGEASPDLLAMAEESGAIVHRAHAEPSRRSATPHAPEAIHVAPAPPSRARQILAQWRGFPDYQRVWTQPGVELGLALHSRHPFDVMWSTSPPESVHFVARRLASRVPWVADFRDPWADYFMARWDPVSRTAIRTITRWALAPAVAVTSATQGVGDSIARASHREVQTIHTGYTERQVPAGPVEPRTLGYFGRLDATQQPHALWPALRQLRENGKRWRVLFFLVGGGGGTSLVDVPEDLREDVDVFPPLPYGTALDRMARMAALLVLVPLTRQAEQIVTGKLFDYLSVGRPILVLGSSASEARRLVEHTRAGIGAWTSEELVAALGQLESFAPDVTAREASSRGRTASRLVTLLQRAAARSVPRAG